MSNPFLKKKPPTIQKGSDVDPMQGTYQTLPELDIASPPTTDPKVKRERSPESRKSSQYHAASMGQLEDLIRQVLAGTIPIPPDLLRRAKKGYPKQPFGGTMKKAGGWNSITYFVLEALIASGKVYLSN